MATVDKDGTVSLEELVVSTLATAEALAKLLTQKGIITAAEFMRKLWEERASYQALIKRLRDEG